jgi:hypothetical protein
MSLAKFTDIVILLDGSASMLSRAESTRSSLIEFINGQKAVPGEANITIVEFSEPTAFTYRLQNVPLASFSAEGFVYAPYGRSTALRNAWSRLIDARGAYYAQLPEASRPEKVLFIVITDGQDNCSTVSSSAVQSKVKHQESVYKWDFVYLGSNQNAELEAVNYGVLQSKAMTYNDANFAFVAEQGLSKYATALRSVGQAEFTAEDKARAKGE